MGEAWPLDGTGTTDQCRAQLLSAGITAVTSTILWTSTAIARKTHRLGALRRCHPARASVQWPPASCCCQESLASVATTQTDSSGSPLLSLRTARPHIADAQVRAPPSA